MADVLEALNSSGAGRAVELLKEPGKMSTFQEVEGINASFGQVRMHSCKLVVLSAYHVRLKLCSSSVDAYGLSAQSVAHSKNLCGCRLQRA